MTNRIKQYSLLLIAMIALPIVSKADTVKVDFIYYNLLNGNTAEVTCNPNGYFGDIEIPEIIKYDGHVYNVVSIGHYAFCRINWTLCFFYELKLKLNYHL